MADPRYPSRRVDFENAVARMNAQDEQVSKEREKRTKREAQAEGESTKGARGNAAVRKEITDAAAAQSQAILSVREALELETSRLIANTKAWEASGRARAGATAAANAEAGAAASGRRTGGAAGAAAVSYPSTSVGFGNAAARIERQSTELESRLAQQAAARATADRIKSVGASYAAGLPPYAAARSGAPSSAAERALASLRSNPAAAQNSALLAAGLTPALKAGGQAAGALSQEEAALEAHHQRIISSLGGVGAAQRNANLAFRESISEVAASSQALTRHGALSTEFIQSFVRGEVTLKQFGSSLVSTIGKFGGWAVAGGLVYGAFEALKRVADGAKETQAGVHQLERAIPDVNKKEAEEGFRRASTAINVPIKDIAEAQFFAARAGFHGQKESLQAGEIGVEALKLDEVPVQDATKALGAVRQAFGLTIGDVKKVFHELNQGQLEFNARLSQTLPQLGRAASAYANAGGKVTGLTRELVSVVGITGGGGGTGGGNPATFFIREPSNLARPSAIQGLRRLGLDPIKGAENIEAFNEEIRQKASEGKYTDNQIREIAKLVGGGGGQGGRYGIANIVSGPSGRQAEIDAELAKQPSGGRAEDLPKKLKQIDEQLSSVGIIFEHVGSAIGQSGITVAIEGVIKLLHAGADAFGFLAGPLTTLGAGINDFAKIPLLPQVLALGALSKVIGKFTRSDTALGLSRPLSEVPGLGGLNSEAKRQLIGLKSTVGRGLEDNARELESEQNNAKRAARALQQTTAQRAAFLGSPEGRQGEAALRNPATRNSEEARVFSARIAAENDGVLAAQQRVAATRANVVTLQEENLILQRELALYKGRGSAQEKVRRGVAEYGASVGPYGNTEPIIGGGGYTGTKREAELKTAGAGIKEAEISTAAAGAAYAGAVESNAKAIEAAQIPLREAFATATEQVTLGGIEIGVAFQAAVAEIRAGGLGAAGGALGKAGGRFGAGARDVGGGLGGLFGAGTSGLGGKLTGAFFTAYIGSAIAEVIGENVIGGKTGKKIASIGGDVAVGAALGSLVGAPFIGAGVGAAYGLLFGGDGEGNKKAEDRLKESRRKSAADLKRIEKGLGGGEGEGELEFAADAYAKTLEEAFTGEGDAATKAKNAIEKANKAVAANLKVFGQKTPTGRAVGREVQTSITGAVEDFLKNPSKAPEAVALIEQIQQTGLGQNKEELARRLKHARTPAQIDKAVQDAQNTNQGLYAAAVPRVTKDLYTKEHDSYKQIERDRAKVAQLEKEGKGTAADYTGNTELNKLKQQIQDAKKTAQSIRRLKALLKEAQEGFTNAVTEAAEAAAAEGFQAKQDLVAPRHARELAEVGADPAAKRRLEQKYRTERAEQGEKALRGRAPKEADKLREETRTADVEAAQAREREHAESIDRAASTRIAKLPAGSPKAVIDRIKAKAASEKATFEKIHKAAFTPAEIREAENAALEARKAASEAAASDRSARVSLEGQIAQARDQGNPVAQANDARATAQKLLGLAKTTQDRLSAQLGVVQAGNQLQQALQGRISALGELAESRTTDPLKQAKIKVSTDRALLKNATPEEKIKDQAALNNDLHRLTETRVTAKEDEVNFHLQMQQISSQQAIDQYQNLLKMHNLTKKTRQDILLKIHTLQNEIGGTSGVYDLKPGAIKLPTAYDVHRAIQGAAGGATLLHAGDQHTNTTNHITIYVRNADDVHKVADVMDRATGAGVRTRARAAGIRGN